MYSQKHPRWWLQSYLAGVSTLVLGGRDKQGKLLKVGAVLWCHS
jgi:RAT1-interacting protein